MTSLKEFLEDTKIAIDNGFGKQETIFRMFNALYATMELHKPNEYGNCLGCPTHGEFACGLDNEWKHCPTIRAIEAELG